jgi:hypothetical protein
MIVSTKQEGSFMQSRITSVYDQNPARIRFVAHHRQGRSKQLFKAVIGIKLMAGLVTAFIWNFLP